MQLSKQKCCRRLRAPSADPDVREDRRLMVDAAGEAQPLVIRDDRILRRLPATAIDLYVATFRARCDAMHRPGIDEVGMCGVFAGAQDSSVRLLVTDDRAYDALAGLLPDAQAGMISVFGAAARCAELVAGRLGWASDVVTAMVCRDLHAVPAVSLPSELSFRPVRRLADDQPGGVTLTDAVATAMAAAPGVKDPPETLAEFLRSLPATFRLFAAVDHDGAVQATSGFGVFGQHATVIFVNTEPAWRRRGIGQAMSSRALRAAQRSGATQACLDASAAGASIYDRLGLESAGTLTRFRNAG